MSQTLVLDHGLEDAKNFARIMYVAHAVIFLCSLGSLSLVPLIFNYLKRPSTAGSFVYSHHTWMIRTFWFSLLWFVVGGALFVTFIGIPFAFAVWGIAWVWYLYRVIRGFVDLNNNNAMPV
ncbi:DUF4870 family protein [Massilia sp. PWRC2]|uniref:DUF4870 family protein n=1 Tax=Massilia sp. PWRC2 TaxID=2804626 RepID=UPI003CFAA0C3